MTIVVTEVTIPTDSFELGQILHDHDETRIELTKFVPTGNGLAPYFWAETDDHDAFEEAVRSDEQVASLTEVDDGPNKRLYHIEWADPMEINGLLDAIRAHNLIVETAVGTADIWRFRLRAANHGGLTEFQRTCNENGIELTINRIWNPSTAGQDPDGLTFDQREALRVAARLGYFESPSKATLDEVGEELGISSQAASKRIRAGVEKVVDSTLFSAD